MAPVPGLSAGPPVVRLGVEECWRLLGAATLGRLCVCVDHRVQVVLTSYVVRVGRVYFRAAAFGAVARRARAHQVTLEVDEVRESAAGSLAGWTVTVSGSARSLTDTATLAALWSPVRPPAWESGREPLWIELLPAAVEGRRLRA